MRLPSSWTRPLEELSVDGVREFPCGDSEESYRKKIEQERLRFSAAWKENPAAQCATIFNRFNTLPKRADVNEVTKDLDFSIQSAIRLFESDFLARYGDLYDGLLTVRTSTLVEALVSQQPENGEFLRQELGQDDDHLFETFDASIRGALAHGENYVDTIRTHVIQLNDGLDRFRRTLNPGFLSMVIPTVVRVLTAGTLDHFGVESGWVQGVSARFTSGIWTNWKKKSDEEFLEDFGHAVEELPVVCLRMDKEVRLFLMAAVEPYLNYRLQYQKAILCALQDMSRAGWDVSACITYLRTLK